MEIPFYSAAYFGSGSGIQTLERQGMLLAPASISVMLHCGNTGHDQNNRSLSRTASSSTTPPAQANCSARSQCASPIYAGSNDAQRIIMAKQALGL